MACRSPLNRTLRTSVIGDDKVEEGICTIVWSQKPSLHAEDGINDLLLL
jgi:hypothetical protein